MRTNDPSFLVSMRVVEWLKSGGRSQKEVAALMDVSDSFVSRVVSGERSLTIDHLTRLEKRLGMPVAVLLLESELAEQQQPEKRAMLGEAISLLRASLDLSNELAAEEPELQSRPAAAAPMPERPRRKSRMG